MVLQRGFEPRDRGAVAPRSLDPLRSKTLRVWCPGFDPGRKKITAAPKGVAVILVLQRGFEPRTPCLKGRCSAY